MIKARRNGGEMARKSVHEIGIVPIRGRSVAELAIEVITQHLTAPLPVRAQLWALPAATPMTSFSPSTRSAVCRSVVVPSPSWPEKLPPQHLFRRVAVNAQLWAPPAATRAAELASRASIADDPATIAKRKRE